MTGTEAAKGIIGAARGAVEYIAAFYEAACDLDGACEGTDAFAAELKSELGAALERLDGAEFPTYYDAQGREHAEF